MTTCDKFEPAILEGQLCYSIDVASIGQQRNKPGKKNGLFLLLDPSPYSVVASHSKREDFKMGEQSFKVYIHTLAQYFNYGPGSYGLSTLKKMTGTTSFKQLPDHQKKCLVHNREECQTRKYLEHVQRGCRCIPWTLVTQQNKDQVKTEPFIFFISLHLFQNLFYHLQELAFCGPEKANCVTNQTMEDKSCLVPCDGIYAYIMDDSLKEDLARGLTYIKQQLI